MKIHIYKYVKGGMEINSPLDIVYTFNSYFLNIGADLEKDIITSLCDFSKLPKKTMSKLNFC